MPLKAASPMNERGTVKSLNIKKIPRRHCSGV